MKPEWLSSVYKLAILVPRRTGWSERFDLGPRAMSRLVGDPIAGSRLVVYLAGMAQWKFASRGAG